jgi:calcineurin-like phosphoesterase family protein
MELKNMKTWIWSDLHLGHKNIIKYCNRPYNDEMEMNIALLNNWENTVHKNDTIINLGDVAFHGNREWLMKQIQDMPGHKILILGNHDRQRSIKQWREIGFDDVYKYPIIYKDFYILSHEPVYINEHMPYVNIHGHTHQESSNNPQKVNVSVECIDYKPIDIQTIFDKYEKWSISNNCK